MEQKSIYPLRLSKTKWVIPIHTRHKCTERCSKIFAPDEKQPYLYSFNDNPDWKNGNCSYQDQLQDGSVQISSFDYNDPCGFDGTLDQPDEVVIPDRAIHFNISFPMFHTAVVTVDFGHRNITRKELILAVCVAYKKIYDIEEKTSPKTSYLVVENCSKCADKKASDSFKEEKISETCSICQCGSSNLVSLRCGHSFHKNCIQNWVDQENKNSCPICRDVVIKCQKCEGKRILKKIKRSVVIPLRYRGMVLNRNTTDGVFRIYGHDLEDLLIERMLYNRQSKLLNISISATTSHLIQSILNQQHI